MTGEGTRSRLFGKLKELAQREARENDELYYDLNLSGVEFFQLIAWIAQEFDVDFSSMKVADYAPNEGFEITKSMMELIGLRPYKSIRVVDLLEAMEVKTWRRTG